MKQLTKEQHEAMLKWLPTILGDYVSIKEVVKIINQFRQDFPPSCCDSCADGETCESDKIEVITHEEKTAILQANFDAITSK